MENERREDYTLRDVMGLVIDRLYFGRRPDNKAMATNGSILKALNKRGYDWPACMRIVEGLALMRDRGKLEPTIKRNRPVDLRWVWDKDQTLNQAEVCQDMFYAAQPKESKAIKGGKPSSILDILNKAV